MTRRRVPNSALAAALGIALAALLPFAARAQASADVCGPIYNTGHYGPYDYRTQRQQLVVVDKYHFAPQVEALTRGQSTVIGGDLNYVLKAAPNHHRALVAMARLGDRTKLQQPEGADYTIDCYYERAVRFAPDDVVARALYAQYLNKHGRRPEAIQHLEAATVYAKDDAFSHYNIGLVYFELGAFDAALAEAWRAQSLGFEREDLVAKLKRADKWRDAPAADAANPPNPSNAASAPVAASAAR